MEYSEIPEPCSLTNAGPAQSGNIEVSIFLLEN